LTNFFFQLSSGAVGLTLTLKLAFLKPSTNLPLFSKMVRQNAFQNIINLDLSSLRHPNPQHPINRTSRSRQPRPKTRKWKQPIQSQGIVQEREDLWTFDVILEPNENQLR
jgi:hypothetical protein